MKLISSMAAREVLAQLIAQFNSAGDEPVLAEAAGGVDVAKRVQQGEAVDVVVLASNAIDKLIAERHLVAGSRVDIATSGVAVAVRAGAVRPDIADEAALRAAVMNARTLSYSTGPSGVHLEKLFERWGVLAELRGRIVVPPPGTAVASLIASGAAALGFQQLSELKNVAGIDVVGPLPPAIQTVTIFSGGVAAASAQPARARALLEFLAAPAAGDVKRRFGMEPA